VTRRNAIQILIKHAADDIGGTGRGLRTLPSTEERNNVRQAIQRLYKDAYGRYADENDLFNLGIL
jgi:hypothetical protein